MRTIKFRVWDPNNDTMTENVGIDKIHLYDFDGDNITEQEGLIIMQYTGLKDRNGKEIYEGDIVFTPAWERKGEVLFKDGMFKFVDIESSNGWKVSLITVTSGVNCCEIIGNKYANPELVSA